MMRGFSGGGDWFGRYDIMIGGSSSRFGDWRYGGMGET